MVAIATGICLTSHCYYKLWEAHPHAHHLVHCNIYACINCQNQAHACICEINKNHD